MHPHTVVSDDDREVRPHCLFRERRQKAGSTTVPYSPTPPFEKPSCLPSSSPPSAPPSHSRPLSFQASMPCAAKLRGCIATSPESAATSPPCASAWLGSKDCSKASPAASPHRPHPPHNRRAVRTPPYGAQSARPAYFRTDRMPLAKPPTPRERIARAPASGLGSPDAFPYPVDPLPDAGFGKPFGGFGDGLPEALGKAAFPGRALFGEAARAHLPMPARLPGGHRAAFGFPAASAVGR